ncbi:hypothetical protein [Flavobacterium sp. AED]|uniref:hypothetical protein n=1 Tax=Flavobacterium sp. AED TaxID=1423323 RepID=UPI000AFB9325|nr:hypothetical protein [Flavobacterium sp. AED]
MSLPQPRIDGMSLQNLSQRLSESEGSFLLTFINYKDYQTLPKLKVKLIHNRL